MIEELKGLQRLTPSAGFKDGVHARLPVPEPRRLMWPLPLAAAAGILVGILGTMLFVRTEPTPAPTAPPRLQAALRDHAHRARTFMKQADQAPADLIEADYQISGLGPRTRELLEEPTDRLPESERHYVQCVARPMQEIGRLIEARQANEAIVRISLLRAQDEFRAALEAVGPADPATVVAMAVEPFQESEAHAFLEGRALLYERAYGAAMARFQSFAHHYPKSDLADDSMYWAGHTALENGQLATALNYYVHAAPNGWITEDDCHELRGIADTTSGNQTIVLVLGDDQRKMTVNAVVGSLTQFQVTMADGNMVISGAFDTKIQQIFEDLEQTDPEGVTLESPKRARISRDLIWRLRRDRGETYDSLIERFPFIGADWTRPR